MTTRDTLEESLRHLEYELAMIVATPRMVTRHGLTPAKNTERPDGYYWGSDRAIAYLAAMESNLVHARLLDDFFRYATGETPATGNKAMDRYAVEYCIKSGWSGYRVLTDDQHLVIDRQLSHFTTLREPRSRHPLGQFAQRAIHALALLAQRADGQWMPRLELIRASCETELMRGAEAWDAT